MTPRTEGEMTNLGKIAEPSLKATLEAALARVRFLEQQVRELREALRKPVSDEEDPQIPADKLWHESNYNRDNPLWSYIQMINDDLQDAYSTGFKNALLTARAEQAEGATT